MDVIVCVYYGMSLIVAKYIKTSTTVLFLITHNLSKNLIYRVNNKLLKAMNEHRTDCDAVKKQGLIF